MYRERAWPFIRSHGVAGPCSPVGIGGIGASAAAAGMGVPVSAAAVDAPPASVFDAAGSAFELVVVIVVVVVLAALEEFAVLEPAED